MYVKSTLLIVALLSLASCHKPTQKLSDDFFTTEDPSVVYRSMKDFKAFVVTTENDTLYVTRKGEQYDPYTKVDGHWFMVKNDSIIVLDYFVENNLMHRMQTFYSDDGIKTSQCLYIKGERKHCKDYPDK